MYWVRHGQSTFNLINDRTGIDPEIADPPLTPQGEAQARRAGMALRGKDVRRIVSSPYRRALQTASIVAEICDMPVQVEPLVGERALYSCDIGSPVATLREAWPQLDFSELCDGQWWPAQGEGERSLRARLDAFAGKWAAHDDRAATVCVSHWYFIRAATGRDMENGEVHAAWAF